MWQTPLSIVSARNGMPRDSSSVRDASTSSTRSAIGTLLGLERDAQPLAGQQGQGDAAGLELGADGLLSGALPHAGARQAEDLAVELHRRREVAGGDRHEVDAGDDRCRSAHR
jgi:hypothetical protein